MATSSPRNFCSSRFFSFSRSLPLNVAVPLTIRPGGCGMSPRIDIVETLLPEPDSPTMPRISPGKTSYEMSSTACTMPSSVRNSTTRFRMERTGSGTNPALLRIECVAQTVADEVDAEHDRDDREAREHGQPPFLRIVLTVGDEDAERGRGRLDPEPEERERRLDQDAGRDGKGARDDDGAERVRQDVPEHDARVAGAGRARRLDVFLLAQREEDAAHDAGDACPEEERDDDRHAPLAPLALERRDGQQHGEQRQRQHEVGQAHQQVVDQAAEVAGDRTQREPDDRAEECDEEADLLR